MGSTTTEAPTLWAVHVQGPDDVLAAESREAAERTASEMNAAWSAYRLAHPDDSGFQPNIHAVVVPWDASTEAHASEVARLARDGYEA